MIERAQEGYRVGSLTLDEIVAEHGLPLYIYDAERMICQYRRMENALDLPRKRIHYAAKALGTLAILRLFRQLGAGLDTVSIEEIDIGLRAGFAARDIVYTPSSVSIEEFERAIERGVRVNVDNLETLEHVGHEHPGHPVCIRFNPHILAGGNRKIAVGHIDSKFGISIHQLPHVERLVRTLGIRVEGVHMHTGSDILDMDVFLQAAEILFDAVRRFESVDYVDLGSGFKVPYTAGDVATDIDEFGERISERFRAFCEELGRDLLLMFEPGKYLVSEAGTFLARVNLVKQTTSTVFACVDSGFNHFLRPMFYDAHHEILNVSNLGGRKKIYTVVGYICETDTFGYDRTLEEVRKGDILAFRNAGAYGHAMSSNYNARPRAAEVLVHEGKAHLVRRRESIEDLLSTQADVHLDV